MSEKQLVSPLESAFDPDPVMMALPSEEKRYQKVSARNSLQEKPLETSLISAIPVIIDPDDKKPEPEEMEILARFNPVEIKMTPRLPTFKDESISPVTESHTLEPETSNRESRLIE